MGSIGQLFLIFALGLPLPVILILYLVGFLR